MESEQEYINQLEGQVDTLKGENAELNIILYHRENGLSHPDLQGDIDKSKMCEENTRLREALEMILRHFSIHTIEDSRNYDKAKQALKGI